MKDLNSTSYRNDCRRLTGRFTLPFVNVSISKSNKTHHKGRRWAFVPKVTYYITVLGIGDPSIQQATMHYLSVCDWRTCYMIMSNLSVLIHKVYETLTAMKVIKIHNK